MTFLVLTMATVGFAKEPADGKAGPEEARRVTLSNRFLEATFHGGQLQNLRDRRNGQGLLHAEKREPVIPLFGGQSVDLRDSSVKQRVTRRSLVCRYSWPDGSVWDLNWELESGGDLVLRTSAQTAEPVSQLGIVFPGCDLADHGLTTVTNFGVGLQVKAPWEGMIGDPETFAYRQEYVQPLVALFEGEGSGWFLEGRDLDLGPANVLAYGRGATADVVLVRGFPVATRTPQMFEVRLRTYQGNWPDAVDPYVDWLEQEVGLLPLDRKPLAWVRDIRAQAAIDVGNPEQLEALAQRVEPTQTLLGKIAEYRKYPFDVNWPNYEVTEGGRKWIARARELGFHVAAHFNTTGIDRAYPDLIQRFRPGLTVTGTDADGKEAYWGWTSAGGTHVYCSTAYQPWRDYLIEQMRPVVEAGVDVIYLDESHTPTGQFVVDGMTAIQGVMALEKEILEDFPQVALYTEQFNPMNARYASFALNSLNLGHPLGGYLFSRFVKFTGFGSFHAPTDEPTLDALQSWGFQIPGASGEESWLQVAHAFQRFHLDPAPRLPRNARQLSGYAGPEGLTAYYEKHPHQRGLVVYAPGQPEQWFGARVTGMRSWPGPGALRDWLVYDGNTLLGLDPQQTYVFDETVTLPPDRFHVSRIPEDFHLHSQIAGYEGSYFKLVFSGHGEIGLSVPDERCMVFLNGQEIPVDREGQKAQVQCAAPPDQPASLLAFLQSATELVGRWVNLPWQTGSQPPRQGTGYLNPNQADGFFNHVGGSGLLIGRFPEVQNLRLRGDYGMREVSKSAGDGVVRINGREVLRVPAGPRPFTQHPFDADLSAFAGQHVLLEFSSEGPIVGFAAGDWYGPQIVVEE